MEIVLIITVLGPLAAALLMLLVPAASGGVCRRLAVAATGLTLALTAVLFGMFDRTADGLQFVSRLPWLPELGIDFGFGLDGLSLTAVSLTALVAFAGALAAADVRSRSREFYALYLTLVTGALGAFTATNLFFFYFFAEFEVLCIYLLIAGWGRLPEGGDAAERAGLRMTLFVGAGAVLTLLGLLLLRQAGGTFDWAALLTASRSHPFPLAAQKAMAVLFVAGFGVMLSAWPLHVWAPPAYAAAPTAVSMFGAGVLKGIGAYGLLRIAAPLLPDGMRWCAPALAVVGMINILYGAWIALRQKDWKLLLGYASISHAGYLLLGVAAMNAVGWSGAAFMMLGGGLATALMFALVGAMEEQTGCRDVAAFGGLGRRAPFLGVCTVMAALALLGLPGFAGFVSEIMVVTGGWMEGSLLMRVAVVAAVWGLVLSAAYMLGAVRNGVYGPPDPAAPALADIRSIAGRLPYILLLAVLLAFGFQPRWMTDPIERSAVSVAAPAASSQGSPGVDKP